MGEHKVICQRMPPTLRSYVEQHSNRSNQFDIMITQLVASMVHGSGMPQYVRECIVRRRMQTQQHFGVPWGKLLVEEWHEDWP